MNQNEMIYKRKSVRKYKSDPVGDSLLQQIQNLFAEARSLNDSIGTRIEIIGKDQVKCFLPWTAPQVIALFSEEKEGYLENAGFLLQQVELGLQALGLGACWLGMGRLDTNAQSAQKDGLRFVIMLAFGYPDEDPYRLPSHFKRKPLSEIADREDPRLEPARLAPSSINSQPWYFVHAGEALRVYCAKQGFFKARALGEMNRIDMGIALAHMYVANPDTFRFFKEAAEEIKGYGYIGSIAV